MSTYRFDLVDHASETVVEDKSVLFRRPFISFDDTLEGGAQRFVPTEGLETAINTAIAVGQPLLLTGEPGTGKTQSAYYTAYKLGLGCVIHFQVKSDSSARDLLYRFDAVGYFHDAHSTGSGMTLNKSNHIERGPLWEALNSRVPRVLLIDEIDKAPRDFPNDLLHEIDQMKFTVAETGETVGDEQIARKMRPLVFITSNSERRLPDPFLRRCVFHHIRFDTQVLERAVFARRAEYPALGDGFLGLAMRRFLELRAKNLEKLPSTGEFIVWLRVLASSENLDEGRLKGDLSNLPYIGVLLKTYSDIHNL